MEKHSMLMIGKNQHRENGHTAQSNLYIQPYPHQATNDPLHRTGENHFKLYMEPKRACITKTILSKKIKAGGIRLPDFILQGHSHQNSMVPVPKQRHRPMEQNRGLRSNTMQLQSSDL